MEPSISVILIAYNQRDFVRAAIDSVVADRKSSLELICVDDGSSDGTGELMDELASHDLRITVLRLPHSGRPSVARNHGLDHARGRFVCFLDGDDLCHSERFSRLEVLLANAPAADVVLHDYAEFADGTDPYSASPRMLGSAPTERRLTALTVRSVAGHGARWMDANRFALSQVADGFVVYTGSICIRRAHLEARALRFPADRVYGEDNGFWIAAMLNARVALLDAVLVFWRKHPASLTSVRSIDAQLAIVTSQHEMYALLASCFPRAALTQVRARMIEESLEVGWLEWTAGHRVAAIRSYWRTTLSMRTMAGFRRIAASVAAIVRGSGTPTVA